MSWLRAKPLIIRERCPLPDPAYHRKGSVWRCDICGQRWTLRNEPGSRTFKAWVPRMWPWPRGRPAPPGGWPGHPLVSGGDDDET